MGRPTKVEGNPLHPASLGGTDAFAQAAVSRSTTPTARRRSSRSGEIRPWSAFLGEMRLALAEERAAPRRRAADPDRDRLLADARAAARASSSRRFPAARWHQWEPAARDDARERRAAGVRRAGRTRSTGSPTRTSILSLDADFLACGPAQPRLAREFAARRREGAAGGAMNRLYVVESAMTATGARADHRLPLQAAGDRGVRALASRRSSASARRPARPSPADVRRRSRSARAVASDLVAHRGRERRHRRRRRSRPRSTRSRTR